MIQACKVEIGQWVFHNGSYWEVLDTQTKGPIVTFITHLGGHVSFWRDQFVKVTE
ncbi:hypothetical protein Ahp2_46 [Aeromonas phage Ahp2]|nr:hypothetical protein Ahp2_46 [Aeromonas phage Ahp2]